MTSEPRMPIGTSFCGFLASSAVVATMSKPMKAKKTMAAPAITPPSPKTAGSMPSSEVISGVCSKPPPLSGTGCDSGMNGTQLDGST